MAAKLKQGNITKVL